MSNLVGVGFASSSSSSSAPSRPVAVLQVGGGGVNHAMMFSAQDYALSESVDFTTQRYLRATQFLFSNEVGFFSQFRVGSYYGFRDFLFPSQGGVDWDKRHVFEVLQPTAPCKGYCDVDLLTSGLAESERADVLSHGPTGFVIHLVQFMNSVFLPSLSLKTKTATSSAIVASSTTEEAASALLASDDDVDKASPPSPPPLAGARCSNIGCGNDGSVTVALQPFTAANVVALDSTSLTKMSFHFVFDHPQLLFADNHAVYHFMGWFQVHVLTRTDASDPVRTFFKAIDFCVYTMNQQFRMAGNSKLRKSSAAVNPPFLSPVGITVDGCSTKMPSILAAVKYFTPDITRWPAEGGGAAHTYKEVVDSARSFFLSTLVCPPRTQRVGDGEGFGEGERIVFVQPVPKGEGRVRFSKSFGVTMQEFSSFVRGAGMLSASSDRVGESLGDGGDDDNPVMFDVRDVWVDGASGTQVDGRCIFSFTHTLDFEAEHWRRRMEWNKGHEQPFPTSHVMVLDAERRGGGEDRSRASGTGPGPEGARGGPERPRLLKATSDVGESDGFKVNPAYDGMLWVPNSCLPNEPVIHSIINFMQAVHRQIRKSGWKDDGFEIEEISWSSAVKKVTKYTLEWLSLVVSIRSRQCATAKIVHKDSRICYSIDTTNGELKQLCANKECVSKQSGSGSRGALITGLDNLPERENPSLERELRDISEYVRAKLKDLQLKQKQQGKSRLTAGDYVEVAREWKAFVDDYDRSCIKDIPEYGEKGGSRFLQECRQDTLFGSRSGGGRGDSHTSPAITVSALKNMFANNGYGDIDSFKWRLRGARIGTQVIVPRLLLSMSRNPPCALGDGDGGLVCSHLCGFHPCGLRHHIAAEPHWKDKVRACCTKRYILSQGGDAGATAFGCHCQPRCLIWQ